MGSDFPERWRDEFVEQLLDLVRVLSDDVQLRLVVFEPRGNNKPRAGTLQECGIDHRLEQIRFKVCTTRQFVIDDDRTAGFQKNAIRAPGDMDDTPWSRDWNIVKLVFRGQDKASPIFEGSGSCALCDQFLAPILQRFRQTIRGFGSLLLQEP